MSIELPADIAYEVAEPAVEAGLTTNQWVETAVAVVFTVSAILIASFIAVMTVLV